MTLDDAIRIITEDLRAEDPGRNWTDDDAVETLREGLSLAEVEGLVGEDMMDEQIARAYRMVLTAPNDEVDHALGR